MKWSSLADKPRDVVRAEASQDFPTKFFGTRTSSIFLIAPNLFCWTSCPNSTARITVTFLLHGPSWKNVAGAVEVNSNWLRLNSKKLDSSSERGKAADTNAIFLASRFTRLMIATASSTYRKQGRLQVTGKIRIGIPNLTLLCPSSRGSCMKSNQLVPREQGQSALFGPFLYPVVRGPLYIYQVVQRCLTF